MSISSQPISLGSYRQLAAAVFGEDSRAVAFLDEKIKTNPAGENAQIWADQAQMITLLGDIHFKRTNP